MQSSLIMATYNGEKYISQQLKSIKNQTRLLDEVIIRDDCSMDSTPRIIKKFINDNNLTNWSFIENEKNIGWRKNFSRLLKDAGGDVIFLSDQDDYWYPSKVEEMLKIFLNNSNIELLVSDYKKRIDADANDVKMPPITESFILDDLYQILPEKNNYYIGRPGWTFALRNTLAREFDHSQKFISNKGHDVLLWQLALSRNTLFHVKKETGIWNLHSSSAMAVENKKKIVNNRELIVYLEDESNIKKIMLKELTDKKNIKFINFLSSSKKCDVSRIKILRSNSLIMLLKNWSSYSELRKFVGDFRRLIIPKYYKSN